ncbi:hypothetical protein J2W27_000210 [Variovorax boronicumulans]|uniref:hypothetical protein n=1 Tax=Variovorax boronicumulans TaxID=436515 RepID=UPI0027837FF4|nr:hypothetical protein [Variovorax boronicumulans]MDP9908117.1 hypothetical protein [Variovorax boronicumulans]
MWMLSFKPQLTIFEIHVAKFAINLLLQTNSQHCLQLKAIGHLDFCVLNSYVSGLLWQSNKRTEDAQMRHIEQTKCIHHFVRPEAPSIEAFKLLGESKQLISNDNNSNPRRTPYAPNNILNEFEPTRLI